MTKCQHCDADILSTSQPNRMGTTPEMQKMYDEFGTVTDEMVEIAWAAIVGGDIAKTCFNASIIRADLKTGLTAALAATPAETLERIAELQYEAGMYKCLYENAQKCLAATPAVGGDALNEPRFQKLDERLLHAITTASNDDVSEPMSEKRLRHCERVSAMYVAIDFIAAANRANFKSYQALDDRATKLRRAALSTTPPEEDTFLQALQAAKQAIEYSLEMGGTDPAGVLLQALNKCKSALFASPPEQPAAGSVTEWQPIETAPRNGRDILISCGFGVPTRIAFWDDARGGIWSLWPGRERIYYPRHWMPLPEAPSAQETQA